eukprot:COSAG02_NODE_21702_length_778_cov_0.877761_1_plen_227_part_10
MSGAEQWFNAGQSDNTNWQHQLDGSQDQRRNSHHVDIRLRGFQWGHCYVPVMVETDPIHTAALRAHELRFVHDQVQTVQPFEVGTTVTLTPATAQPGMIYHCAGIPHAMDCSRSVAWLLWISNRQDHGAPTEEGIEVLSAAPPSWSNPVVQVLLSPGDRQIYTTLQHIAPHGFPCLAELQQQDNGEQPRAVDSMAIDGAEHSTSETVKMPVTADLPTAMALTADTPP